MIVIQQWPLFPLPPTTQPASSPHPVLTAWHAPYWQTHPIVNLCHQMQRGGQQAILNIKAAVYNANAAIDEPGAWTVFISYLGTALPVAVTSVEDMIQQLERLKAQGYQIHALTIHDHGNSGGQQVGRDFLLAVDEKDVARLKRLGVALAPDAVIILRGCSIASDAAGKLYVQRLAAITGHWVFAPKTKISFGPLGSVDYYIDGIWPHLSEEFGAMPPLCQ